LPDTDALALLNRYLDRRASLVAAEPMAPEHIEELRALGYLDPEPNAAAQDGRSGSEDVPAGNAP